MGRPSKNWLLQDNVVVFIPPAYPSKWVLNAGLYFQMMGKILFRLLPQLLYNKIMRNGVNCYIFILRNVLLLRTIRYILHYILN